MNRSTFKKDFKENPYDNNLPISFGGNFHDDPLMRPNLRKSHTLSNHACGATIPEGYAPHTSYDFRTGGDPLGASAASQPDTRREDLRRLNEFRHPELLFLAYVREPVYESAVERVRIRKLGITFYTQDGSISINEARQQNSGISQGQFLARQKVPKDGAAGATITDSGAPAGLFTEDDLFIGNTVNIYGRDITITGMTAATRAYFAEKGVSVPAENDPWPADDTYNVSMAKSLTCANPMRRIPTSDMENKRALESLTSGGQITKHHPEDIRCAQQFFANNINQHLTFAALYDNRARISGDLHRVVLNYYLENDTIEIVEDRKENHGKDGGPKLLVRQRVPKAGADTAKARTQHNTFGIILKSDYMTAEDFAIDSTVTIHSRPYYIYDADEFTRNYFVSKFGKALGPAVDVSPIINRDAKPPVVHYPPPHNGFGTDIDSLQNCKGLMLRPPPIDAEKQWREMDKTMIFSAVLETSDPVDAHREFVVTFHRATDEVEIGEKNIRNSGVIGGKFLAKGRHLKELPSGKKIPFSPSDFAEGRAVRIAGRTFLLQQMDEKSRKVALGIEDAVTEDRVRELVLLFRTLVATKYLKVQEAFRAIAPSGALTVPNMVDFFRRSSCRVREDEAMHVVQHVAPDGNGTVTYDQFLRFVDGSEGTSSMEAASNNPKSIKNVNMTLKDEFKTATVVASEDHQRRRLTRLLADKLAERRGTTQEVFRLMAGHAYNARLSRAAFSAGMADVLHFRLGAADTALLLSVVFDGREDENGEITYKQFSEFVESA